MKQSQEEEIASSRSLPRHQRRLDKIKAWEDKWVEKEVWERELEKWKKEVRRWQSQAWRR